MSSDQRGPRTTPETRGRLLLVDDEPLFRDSTSEILRASGFDCTAAEGPAQALACLAQRAFDVIVADLVMDGAPQIEFLEQISARPDAPAIILVTAYPSIESAIAAVDLGMIGYLSKPFEPAALVERIHKAIQRRELASVLTGHESSLRSASETLQQLARMAGLRGSPATGDHSPGPRPRDAMQLGDLTPRESDVVQELMEGYRLSTIARRLGISLHTVRRHLKSIFLKLEVGSQAELLEKLKP